MAKFKLKRYHEYKERENDICMFEEPDGEWVKWEDVEPLLSNITETLGRILTNLEIDSKHLDEMIKKAKEN